MALPNSVSQRADVHSVPCDSHLILQNREQNSNNYTPLTNAVTAPGKYRLTPFPSSASASHGVLHCRAYLCRGRRAVSSHTVTIMQLSSAGLTLLRLIPQLDVVQCINCGDYVCIRLINTINGR